MIATSREYIETELQQESMHLLELYEALRSSFEAGDIKEVKSIVLKQKKSMDRIDYWKALKNPPASSPVTHWNIINLNSGPGKRITIGKIEK